MIDNEEVAAAVAGAVGQAPLDAGVNLTGLLIDMDRADSVDSRRYFMCWQLTRVLAPSLAEKVSPALARKVINGQQPAPPQSVPPDRESRRVGSAPAAGGTVWWLSAMLMTNAGEWLSRRHDYLWPGSAPIGTDSWTHPHSGPEQGVAREPGQYRINGGGPATTSPAGSPLDLWRSPSPFRSLAAVR
ncbi:MAG TPA: hypothetical protein VHH34_21385 [Pseudonocardiaceae bacterium]|nr:hypothetical protein [Pseudonocardiaceae bacterium]